MKLLIMLLPIMFLVGCEDDKCYEELTLLNGMGNHRTNNKQLSYEELYPIIEESKAIWLKVIDNESYKELDDLEFQIVRFKNNIIGYYIADQHKILIDAYADWFIDKTPEDDSEFEIYKYTNVLVAKGESEANMKVDLLTAVSHEIGHALGLHDIEEASRFYRHVGLTNYHLMYKTLLFNHRNHPTLKDWKNEN